MKKILISILALATALFATSCQEELTAPEVGGEATVTLSVGLNDGVSTRAIGDATMTNQLTYSVFDAKGAVIYHETVSTKFPANVEISLAKGQTYNIVCWAQHDLCSAYTIDNNMNLTIDYAGANNDEKRDAFFGSEEFSVAGDENVTVTLKRPFAQLNVGITQNDWDAAVASNVTIERSTVKISNAATNMDLKTGKVSNSTAVEYTADLIPAETLKITTQNPEGTEPATVTTEYKYLSMSYLLVDDLNSADGAGRTLLSTVSFDFIPVSGTPINFSEGLNNIPVARNWRTNIVGQLLTGDVKFKVELAPAFDGDIEGWKPEVTPSEPDADPTLYDYLRAGGVVEITDEFVDENGEVNIDFNTLVLNNDVYILVDKTPVKSFKFGGNTGAADIVVDFTANAEYPEEMTFAANTKDLTIKFDQASTKELKAPISIAGRNISISGIKAKGANKIFAKSVNGLTIQNCVATDMTETFIWLEACTAKVLNNTISYADISGIEKHGINLYAPGVTLVEGNTINNADKHGIMVNWGNYQTITINNNIINGVGEDGIKADKTYDLVITNNTIKATEYGVCATRYQADAKLVVTGNSIELDAAKQIYAVTVGDKNQEEKWNIALTVKENTAKAVKSNHYFDIWEILTVTGQYDIPFVIADGLGIMADGSYGIYNGKGLAYASENLFDKLYDDNKVVNIVNDIDMSGIEYTPCVYGTNTRGLTLNGNGNVISNLTIVGDKFAALFGRVSSQLIINDLIIKDANLSTTDSGKYAENSCGAFIGWHEDHTVANNSVLRNCKAINVTYGSSKYVGGLVGRCGGSGDAYLTIDNCLVEGANITSEYFDDNVYKGHCGGLVGGSYGVKILNSIIKNSIMTVKGDRYGSILGSAMGAPADLTTGNVVENVTINGAKATSENVLGSVNNGNIADPSFVTVK